MSNNYTFDLETLAVGDEIYSLLRSKRREYINETVALNKVDEFLKKGWEKEKRNKKSYRLKKSKGHNIWLEDRMWSLLAQMGFNGLNKDRNFKLGYTKNDDIPGKQIDVFSIDDETALVVECKSSLTRRTVSFQKEINEINGIREGVTKTISSIPGTKRKIAWIMLTENLVLNENDKNRLKEHRIIHLNQDDLHYYERLLKQIGKGAKYQFFGRLFSNQQIPSLKNRIPAIKGEMGGFTYFSFSVEPETLLKISFVLHRTNTSDDVLNSYQRIVKGSRVKEIGRFLDNNGFFPNSIILNINSGNKKLRFDPGGSSEHDSNAELGVLYLPKKYRSAFIIDGQHRLYGYANNDYRFTNTIPVVAFENLPAEVQSKLFVDINHKQKSVPANLLSSLDAELKWSSENPDEAIRAVKSKLVQVLSEREASPLYNRINTSEDPKTYQRCITLKYVFDYGLNKTSLFGNVSKKSLISTGPLYGGDLAEKTLEKSYSFFAKCFTLVERRLPEQWEKGDLEGGFVAKNIGVSSIIVILSDIIDYLQLKQNKRYEGYNADEIYDETKPYLEVVLIFLNDLSRDNLISMGKQYGSTGVGKVRREFQRALYEKYDDFKPDGLEKYIRESSGMFNDITRESVIEVQNRINEFIFFKLKEEFGNKWWTHGVRKEIQKSCASKKIDEGTSEPDENFLELINYKTIVGDNWKLLGDFFTHPDMKQAKKDDRLKWFVDLNNIRKKGMHPERVDITEEEHDFIAGLRSWLLKNFMDS